MGIEKLSIFLSMATLVMGSTVFAEQDKEYKETQVQVVIHRLLPDKNGETFELSYNPRGLKTPYEIRLYGTVDQLVYEYIGCSNAQGDVWVLIARRSKDRYIISIAMSDKPQPFPELETWTYFNSFKEGEEILRTQTSPDNNKTYQISVMASRYHTYQGGVILQCHKDIFPLDPRSRPN